MDHELKPIEQHFAGTPEELEHFLFDYVLLRHALRPPEAKGDYFVLTPFLDVRHLWVLRRFNKRRVELSRGPRGEGTFAVSEMTADPRRARYICRPVTVACRKLALNIAREIKRGRYDSPRGPRVPPKQNKRRGKPGMQVRIQIALQELRRLRQEGIDRGVIPTMTAAASMAGISYKTSVKYAPELHAKWFDKDYTEPTLE